MVTTSKRLDNLLVVLHRVIVRRVAVIRRTTERSVIVIERILWSRRRDESRNNFAR
jgi:hypothetical protein